MLREEEPDLVGIGVEPSVAIGQRALLVRTPNGNVLWDCVPLLDDAARERDRRARRHQCDLHVPSALLRREHRVRRRLRRPGAHPAAPTEQWIQRPSPRIELFDDEVEPVPGVTLARIGGHFDGAAVLHWPAGPDGRGALLTGDTITVVQDRDWVSFMWSYPNLIPLDEATVHRHRHRVERFAFDRVYGGWWGRSSSQDGPGAIRRSADRYVARLHGERPGR